MNTSKTITDRYVFDAYGNDMAPGLHNTTEGNSLRFRWNGSYGYRTLPGTNVIHVGARHYSPEPRRFLQRDPGGLTAGDPNLYQFGGNQPVTRYDIGGYEDTDKSVWERLYDWWKSGEMGSAIPVLGGLAQDAGDAVGRYDCGQATFLEAAGKSALLLGAIGLSAVAIEQAGAAALRAPKSLPNVTRAPKTPYEIAKAGGKHSGTLRTMSTRSIKEVSKAIRSLAKKSGLHRDKIANPRKYVPDWDKWDKARKCKQLSDWKQEIQGFEEQIKVLDGLLKELGG